MPTPMNNDNGAPRRRRVSRGEGRALQAAGLRVVFYRHHAVVTATDHQIAAVADRLQN
jgi:hypothetical protein